MNGVKYTKEVLVVGNVMSLRTAFTEITFNVFC